MSHAFLIVSVCGGMDGIKWASRGHNSHYQNQQLTTLMAVPDPILLWAMALIISQITDPSN